MANEVTLFDIIKTVANAKEIVTVCHELGNRQLQENADLVQMQEIGRKLIKSIFQNAIGKLISKIEQAIEELNHNNIKDLTKDKDLLALKNEAIMFEAQDINAPIAHFLEIGQRAQALFLEKLRPGELLYGSEFIEYTPQASASLAEKQAEPRGELSTKQVKILRKIKEQFSNLDDIANTRVDSPTIEADLQELKS